MAAELCYSMEISLSILLTRASILLVHSTFAIMQLLGYFAERMISKETLLRNNVMQVAGGKVRK